MGCCVHRALRPVKLTGSGAGVPPGIISNEDLSKVAHLYRVTDVNQASRWLDWLLFWVSVQRKEELSSLAHIFFGEIHIYIYIIKNNASF